MLKTLSLARRPSLKLLDTTSGCSTVSQWLRLQHGRLQPTVVVPSAPPRAPARTPGPPPRPPRKLPHAKREPRDYRPAEASLHDAQPVDPLLQKVQAVLGLYRNAEVTTEVINTIRADPDLQRYFMEDSQFHGLLRRMLYSSSSKHVVALIDLGAAMGLTLSPSTFRWLCGRATDCKKWDMVVTLADKAVAQCGPSESFFRFRYHALTKQLNYQWLPGALDDFVEVGIKPSRDMFHFMLEAALENLDISQTQRLVEAMEDQGITPNAVTHALIARRHRKVGTDDVVEGNAIAGLLHLDHGTQVATLNSLIRGHLESGAVRRALRLLSLFAPESVETIIEVASGRGGAGETADPISYPEPLPNPPDADSMTYSILIYWCSQSRNLSGALQLLQSMIMSGTDMTESIVAALVETCFTCNRPDLAVQLVAGVCDPETTPVTKFLPLHPEPWPEHPFEVHIPGLKPTHDIFDRFLRGALEYYGLQGAKHVLYIMEKNNVFPNRTSLRQLLGHMLYIEHSHPRTMIRVLQSLTGPHLIPTQEHIGFIVRCIQRGEIFNLHGKGWARLKFNLGSHKTPESRKTTTSDDFESFAGMVMPTFRGYRALMEPFLSDLRFRNIKPNATTIAHRIRHEAVVNMDMDTAYDVFETMLTRGIKASVHHYNALAHGYALKGEPHHVRRVMSAATDAGLRPDRDSYTILMTAFARRGDPEGALRVFGDMVEAGIPPDVPSIDVVAGSFFARGQNTMAKKVLIRLWSFIEEFPEEMGTGTVLELAGHFRTLHRRARNIEVIPRKVQKETNELIHDLVKQWRRLDKGGD